MSSNFVDIQYSELINKLLHVDEWIEGRNGRTKRLFGVMVKFQNNPLVSIRKTAWQNAIKEMDWFLSGSNGIANLDPSVRHWWQPWANEEGIIRFNYSEQFRHAPNRDGGHTDQIQYIMDGLRDHPNSRRLVATTWNPDMLSPLCPITNCHGTVIQVSVNNGKLDLFMYQRSVDIICGLPHNWIQYWAMMLWMARCNNMTVGEFTWAGGDVHLYEAHIPLAKEMIKQHDFVFKYESMPNTPILEYHPSQLHINSQLFSWSDFALNGSYLPVMKDKAEMIV